MALTRYRHAPLPPGIWQLRRNMRPCDAACLALAEALAADLVTADSKASKVPGLRCRVRDHRNGDEQVTPGAGAGRAPGATPGAQLRLVMARAGQGD